MKNNYWKYNNWYDEFIEPEVRDLVRYLRNKGINTECSCGHEKYIQCQYIPDGSIEILHSLLYNYFYKHNLPINYEIKVTHKVINGHSYSTLNINLDNNLL